jgi:DNA modification methylase
MAKRLEETWPASKVALWPIEKIRPYEKNPRQHSQAQIDLIASSMKDDGVTAPILVDEAGVIIYGHGRRLAALQNGYTRYPVAVAIGWSEEKKRAVRIKDNSYAELSTWGVELITAELKDLKLAGYDVPLLGFPESQLRGWGVQMGTEGQADPEATPEPPKKPVVRRGDRWVLGDHILVCGDATSESDVAMCLMGAKPHLCVTDAPYGVNHNPIWREERGVSSYGPQAKGLVTNDDQANWQAAYELFKGDVLYAWSADLRSRQSVEAIEAAHFDIRAQIIWKKPQIIFGRGDYHFQHEPLWYAVRRGKQGHWAGDRKQSTVWEIDGMHVMGRIRGDGENPVTGHTTQKPIECMKRPIENNSRAGDYVYDPFVGSGTTIIAAEMTGRKALAVEIDLAYCEVAIRRWEGFTGRLATLDGKTLDQVAAARRKGKAKRETEDERDVRIARKRLAEIKEHPEQLISGDKLRARLEKLS